MARKTQKARQLQAQEAGLVEHFGDCAKSLADKRLGYNRVVYEGAAKPRRDISTGKAAASVHYQDGFVRTFADKKAAVASLRACCGVSLWDVASQAYECVSTRRYPERYVMTYTDEQAARLREVCRNDLHVIFAQIGDIFTMRVSSACARSLAARISRADEVAAELL